MAVNDVMYSGGGDVVAHPGGFLTHSAANPGEAVPKIVPKRFPTTVSQEPTAAKFRNENGPEINDLRPVLELSAALSKPLYRVDGMAVWCDVGKRRRQRGDRRLRMGPPSLVKTEERQRPESKTNQQDREPNEI
jgi:hypothetical protein